MEHTIILYERCRGMRKEIRLLKDSNQTQSDEGVTNNEQCESKKCILELAIESGDCEAVEKAISDGADLTEQNYENGNTALHFALKENAGYSIIKTLLLNDADVNIKNKNGLDPVQLINRDSKYGFLHMLMLEEYFDYTDSFGNTLAHLVMMHSFCVYLLDDLKNSKYKRNWNTQNMFGQTPLHTAASKSYIRKKEFDYILSCFEGLNLLVADRNGDTFLHIILAYLSEYIDIHQDRKDFVKCLIDGKYQLYSNDVVKALLSHRNKTGYTPLHVWVKHCEIKGEEAKFLDKFVTRGADINSCNIFAESILHYAVPEFIPWKFRQNVAEYAIKEYNAEVNAINSFGESPIFFALKPDIVRILLDAGAKVNICNKVGKSPLTQNMRNENNNKIIEMLISGGADINVRDIHGNTLLHYAAWHNLKPKIIQLKRHGINIAPNNCGELPCHVAHEWGNVELLDELCICKKDSHEQKITLWDEAFFLEELLANKMAIYHTLNIMSVHFRNDSFLNIFKLPGLGGVKFEDEANEVRSTVVQIISEICSRVGLTEDLFSNFVIQSGSAGENTKVGLPDEFDFVCVINLFSEICEMDEAATESDPGYAYIKLKEEYRDERHRYLFDGNNYLNTEIFWEQFFRVVNDIIPSPDLYCHPNVVFDSKFIRKALISPAIFFNFRWVGRKYKDLNIKIDLVPACQIQGWWPQNARLGSLSSDGEKLKKDGALLLLKPIYDTKKHCVPKLRISAMTAEKMHMAGLPQIARDTYMVCKMMCDDRICPVVLAEEYATEEPGHSGIKSYMLKNCLFHVFNGETLGIMVKENMTLDENDTDTTGIHYSMLLHCKVDRTYKDLNIKMDLVPACQIRGWWPQNAQLRSLAFDGEKLKKDGAFLLLKPIYDTKKTGVPKLRISGMAAEKMHMAGLPQIARDI